MFKHLNLPLLPAKGSLLVIGSLVLLNLVFNIFGNASFKLSALAPNPKGFIAWQVAGNLAGLITVLTLTGLLKYLPLHVAQPMVQGLAIIGVQVITARLLFHEAIAPMHWVGTLLIVVGIILIQK